VLVVGWTLCVNFLSNCLDDSHRAEEVKVHVMEELHKVTLDKQCGLGHRSAAYHYFNGSIPPLNELQGFLELFVFRLIVIRSFLIDEIRKVSNYP
jgi:hypothetical protein